jgi:hypothetical protein
MVLLLGAWMMVAQAGWGQSPSAAKPASSSLDVAVLYNASRQNNVAGTSFWMQGASVQIHGQFWRGLGVVADVAELHTANMQGSGVGLDLVTATFGPRYTWAPSSRHYAIFAQVLAGEANGLNSVFPAAAGTTSNATSLALQAGGGMNIHLTPHIAVRAFEADWLRTQLPNATTNVQNNLCLGAGLVFRFR